eukprot:8082192-Alexandrium_andersonii.AAC.1
MEPTECTQGLLAGAAGWSSSTSGRKVDLGGGQADLVGGSVDLPARSVDLETAVFRAPPGSGPHIDLGDP